MRNKQAYFTAFLSLLFAMILCVAGHGDVFSPPALHSVVTLPLEVMGADGTTNAVTVFVPRPASILTMQLHGLENEQEASVRIGLAPWLPLTNSTVQVAQPGRSYGGIGGGYHTLTLSLPITVRPGLVRVSFRFNHTDGINSGFRVLAFNFLDAKGSPLLPASTFQQHDPASETAPLTDATSIAQGKVLWHSAPLVQCPHGPALGVTCADCHSEDGRDLKYFGYTDNSIYERCLFHGLTHTQAEQLTSYIRTFPVRVYGRPWNPPYQPGPGMDARPVAAWAAGAGLSAVLPSDAAMLPSLFPHGIRKEGIGSRDTLNMRELPIALLLPDWNSWLPRFHPKDAWGDVFTFSPFAQFYDGNGPSRAGGTNLRAILANPDPAYHAFITTVPGAQLPSLLNSWSGIDYGNFIQARQAENDGTAAYAEKMTGTERWMLVKQWELMQEYAQEGNAPLIYPTAPGAPTAGESRAWVSEAPFLASPAFIGVPEDGVLYSRAEYEYLTNAWYYAQMVVNSGNRHRLGWHPVDWGYAVGRTGDFSDATGLPSYLRMIAMLIKGGQQADTDDTVDTTYGAFPALTSDGRFLFWHRGAPYQDALDPDPARNAALYAQIATAVAGAQFDALQTHTPSEWQNSSQGGENAVVYGADSLFSMQKETLGDLAAIGVDKTLLDSKADWDKSVWPDFDWDSLKP